MQKQDITSYRFILRKAFLCMLLVGLLLCFSASASSERQLFLGQEAYVEISDATDIQWFVFIPEENGEYVFSSFGMANTVGYLFDADFNSISWTNSDSQGNFHLICELRAGTLYNFAASGNASFYVMLSKNNGVLNGDNWILNNGVLTFLGPEPISEYGSGNAPWHNQYVSSVVIGNGISRIPAYTFSELQHLNSVSIPSSVIEIGDGAFSGCSSLTSISIPDSVTSIGGWVFEGCTSLTSIIISGNVTSIGNKLFKGCTSLMNITIPDSVTSIDSCAFDNCTSLTSITIPGSVISIGSEAFFCCTNLTDIMIQDGVTSINIGAFGKCTRLTSITIPGSINNIDDNAFYNCTNLTSINYSGNEMQWNNIAIGSNNDPLFSASINYAPMVIASGNCGTNVTWTLDDMGILTISGSGRMTNYLFANMIPWYSERTMLKRVVINEGVTSIGSCAFYGCSGLTTIIIPNCVNSIGTNAFYRCSGLKTAGPIGGGYDYEFGWTYSIPDNAFSDCSGLTSVTIPNSVTSIGDYAFQNCSELTSVTIPNSVSMGTRVFAGCTNLSDSDGFIIHNYVFYGYTGSATEISIPYGVTRIDNFAFANKSNLSSVTIPSSVTSIGSNAFYSCSELTSVIIPDSVTSIGDRAFQNCSNLTNVTIPDHIPNMGNNVFDGCTKLYQTDIDGFTIFNHILYGYSGEPTDIIIPDGVTSIADFAFSEKWELTSVIIPNSVTSIGYAAFQNCTNLASVIIPSSVTNIGNSAFLNCSELMNAGPIGGGYNYEFGWINIIPNNAFNGCNNLTSVTIPDTVTSIGENAFEICERLTSITIPDSVTSIGFGAFENCGLTSIVIPSNVTSIGSYTFRGCRDLTSVTISDSITSIGENAFEMCERLTNITIPDSVISIGDDAFVGCYNLNSVHIDSVESWLTIEFSNLYSHPNYDSTSCHLYIDNVEVTSIVIPNSVTSIGHYAFYNCSSLTSVSIPSSVTSIGECAFADLASLSNVTIQCGTSYWDNSFSSWTEINTIHMSVISDAVVNPTCESTGLTAGSHCATCGTILEEREVIDALGHDWDTPKYTWSFDRTTVTAERTCNRDSFHVETETVSVVSAITLSATCTVMGQTTYTANFENEAFTMQSETLTDIDAIGHEWCEPTYIWAADNTSVTASHVCIHDETHIENETVNVTAKVTLPATCTEQGQTTYTSAAFTNEAFSLQTKTLSDIELVAHTAVTDPAVSPTDTQFGLTEGSHCSVCGEILTVQQTIPPLLWEIDKSDGKISIVRYYGNEDELSIPSSLEGCPVRSILNGAFPYENCPARVFIPNSIQSISTTAFERNVTIYCHEYSEADYWAEENDYTAIYVDNTVSGTFYRITMPDDFAMEYGENRELGAKVWPLTGSDIIRVISSHPEIVAADGQTLTAKRVGQATITLQAGGKTARILVTVHADPASFVIEDKYGYSDEVFYIVTKLTKQLSFGEVQPEGAEICVTWTCANESVATVSETGLVKAKRAGQTTVTATTQNGLTRSCTIIVVNPIIEISFDQTEYSIVRGKKYPVHARVTTTDNVYTNQLVVFSSSDPEIATVDRYGIIHTLQMGKVTITATADDGKTTSCTVTVREIESILNLPANLTVIENEAFAYLSSVEAIRIPASVTFIAEDAFSGSNVIIMAPEGSYTVGWAKDHGMTVIEE